MSSSGQLCWAVPVSPPHKAPPQATSDKFTGDQAEIPPQSSQTCGGAHPSLLPGLMTETQPNKQRSITGFLQGIWRGRRKRAPGSMFTRDQFHQHWSDEPPQHPEGIKLSELDYLLTVALASIYLETKMQSHGSLQQWFLNISNHKFSSLSNEIIFIYSARVFPPC